MRRCLGFSMTGPAGMAAQAVPRQLTELQRTRTHPSGPTRVLLIGFVTGCPIWFVKGWAAPEASIPVGRPGRWPMPGCAKPGWAVQGRAKPGWGAQGWATRGCAKPGWAIQGRAKPDWAMPAGVIMRSGKHHMRTRFIWCPR